MPQSRMSSHLCTFRLSLTTCHATAQIYFRSICDPFWTNHNAPYGTPPFHIPIKLKKRSIIYDSFVRPPFLRTNPSSACDSHSFFSPTFAAAFHFFSPFHSASASRSVICTVCFFLRVHSSEGVFPQSSTLHSPIHFITTQRHHPPFTPFLPILRRDHSFILVSSSRSFLQFTAPPHPRNLFSFVVAHHLLLYRRAHCAAFRLPRHVHVFLVALLHQYPHSRFHLHDRAHESKRTAASETSHQSICFHFVLRLRSSERARTERYFCATGFTEWYSSQPQCSCSRRH